MYAQACCPLSKLLTLLLIIVVNVGCTTTYQTHWVEPSGFLDDYSMLSDGDGEDAVLSYWKKDVDWSQYTKMIFEPIAIWTGKDSQLNELSHGQRFQLKESLENQMRESLKKDFRLVVRPSPNTLRVQLVITEAETSITLLDFYSILYPTARVLSELQMLSLGTESWVGSAGYESRITDSETGELLMASVDRRAGSKHLSGAFDNWDDVNESYKHWVVQFTYQLCHKRELPDCQEPDFWF
jgi:hypothetical protein